MSVTATGSPRVCMMCDNTFEARPYPMIAPHGFCERCGRELRRRFQDCRLSELALADLDRACAIAPNTAASPARMPCTGERP